MPQVHEVYAGGGFDPAHPSGNRVEVWDGATGLYTRYGADGAVVEQRPLTAEEAAMVADPPPDPALVALADLAAAVTLEEVRDAAAALAAALEGRL